MWLLEGEDRTAFGVEMVSAVFGLTIGDSGGRAASD